MMRRFSVSVFVVCLVVCLLPACGARRVPDLARIFETARVREGKRPIIVVPGILGSELVNSETSEVVWVSAARSTTDGLDLPVNSDLDLMRDRLVPRDIVRRARFAPLVPEVYVYQELLDALEKYAGYREVRWDEARPGDDADTFFVFAYDWRQDNVRSAQQLVAQVEELKRRLGRPDLRFNIVAHSMGGLVARYAAMYGAADLPAKDTTPAVTWAGAAFVNSVFMFGTPNEGTMEAFSTLLGGYSITEGLRRRLPLLNKLSRADAFTIPSLYQLLPRGASATFLDAELKPFTLDLHDPDVWRRYGWFAKADTGGAQSKKRKNEKAEKGRQVERANDSDAERYFAAVLERARRFRDALDARTTKTPIRFFLFGGDCEETLARPVVVRDERRNEWLTFTESRRVPERFRGSVKREELVRRMYEPGDGRVTRRSLLAESSRAARFGIDASVPPELTIFACDLHGDVQKNKTLQDNALTVLVREAVK